MSSMMSNHRLINGSKIGSANVVVDILPKGRCIPNVKLSSVSNITVHNTGNSGAAKNQHNYMKNNNKPSGSNSVASWHFSVCKDSIYQAIPANYKGFHAGDGTGNAKSVGIEITEYSNTTDQIKAYKNAVELIKILMKYYNLSISRVVQHNHWSGKDCPSRLRRGHGWTWSKFISECKGESAPTTDNKPVSTTYPNGTYSSKFVVDSPDGVLSVRNKRPVNNNLGTKVGEFKNGDVITIGYVLDNWGGVIFNGEQTFVNMTYLDRYEEKIELPSTSSPWKNGDYKGSLFRVTTSPGSNLNVRKGRPGQTNYDKKVHKFKSGEIIEGHYALDGWISVYVDGVANPGFVSMDFLELASDR